MNFLSSKYAPYMAGGQKNILSHFGIGGKSSSYLVAPAPMILLKNIGDRTYFFLLNVNDGVDRVLVLMNR